MGALLCATAALGQTRNFDVHSDAAVNAIPEFARQAGIQIVAPADQLDGVRTHEVKGSLDLHAALSELLAGTDIEIASENAQTIMLRVRPKNAEAVPEQGAASTATKGQPIETVVVTGTNIRGAANPAAPVDSYSRDQIDLSGLGSVQQFVRRLPANFGGGASDETVGSLAGGGNAVNAVGGAGVNLRGLGSDATLVLLDGHRIAPANNAGNFVDVSMIPLSALERVDVLTDGASAIYGSDAVGGVMNLVLRHDFDGAETRARFAAPTDGGGAEEEVAQSLGRTWDGGSALVSYDYDLRSPIYSSQRSYASANANPFTLVPKQLHNSVFAMGNQSLTGDISVFGEGFWSNRSSTNDEFFTGIGDDHNVVTASNYGGTAGVDVALPEDRQFELSTTYSASDSDQNDVFAGAPSAHVHTIATVGTVDAKLDGALFSLPAGPVRFAVGGQYRYETLDSKDLIGHSVYSPNRNIAAGFAELDVPLIGPRDSSPDNRLELSLADRYEHYSDFGSTDNPKIGLSWMAQSDLKFRGTYGTSFRAPLLSDLDPIPSQVVALPEADPTTGGASNVLVVFGGNPRLSPEKSTNWTLGADWAPDAFPGLRVSTTYYNVHFTNLITTAQTAGFDLFDALDNASSFGPLIRRNPPAAEVASLVSTTQEFDDFTGIPGGVDLSTIAAIVDSRSTNLSALDTNGIDFKVSYDGDFSFGHIETGLDGTYILTFRQKVVPTMAATSVLNTQYNPVDLKLRGRVILRHGNFDFALFANYIDSYRDVRSSPSVPIASWTTFDLAMEYNFDQGSGSLLDGFVAGLNVINVADTKPPFVATPDPGVAPGLVFDGANANVLGRVVSLQLTARW